MGGGCLVATYDNHLRLIGKHVVDFLSVLIKLFLSGVTAETLRFKIGNPTGASQLTQHLVDALTSFYLMGETGCEVFH